MSINRNEFTMAEFDFRRNVFIKKDRIFNIG